MILGIGTDLANIERIQGTLDRFGDRFRNREPTQSAGLLRKRVPKHWALVCVWVLLGVIWRLAT